MQPGSIPQTEKIIMTRLNQIVAVEKGAKARTLRAITDVYHQLKRASDFNGLHRVYEPLEDGSSERLPEESQRVQVKVPELLTAASSSLADLFDVVATKENGNMHAKADVVVDGALVVADASVPLLLFLEKQITDWRTELRTIPVLDTGRMWQEDATEPGLYRTESVETFRTKKTPFNHEKAGATDRHPAQVELLWEDVPVGRWFTTKLSGAIPVKNRDALVARADKLLDALKQAREEANSTEITQSKIGDAVFAYLLG